ncbi:hypothetical protein ABPG73_016838 [Tetrahymena malaccensis]
MKKDLQCDMHKNCPVQLIDMLQVSAKKLKCVQCVSNKIQEVSFIYIPQVASLEENLFLDNWPPLSDNLLRETIIKLKNENEDDNQKVVDFYDQLTQEIMKIVYEKKKEQLIAVEKTQEFKQKIINQYCKLASLDKINQCFVNESQKYEEIEKALKEQIDSQYERIDEYTSILQSMIKQYELISKQNIQQSTQIKDNVLQILKILNLFPLYQFDISDQMFSLDNLAAYQKKMEQEYELEKKNNTKIDLLVNQLDLCNKQLTNKINQIDWYLDDYLSNQQKLIATYQIDKAEFLNDIYLNLNQSQALIKQNIEICSQPNFKFYNEIQKTLKLQPTLIYSINNKSENYIQAQFEFKGQILIQKIKNGSTNNSCYLNYMLKPHKKYIFRINFYKSKNNSTFYIGLNRTQNLHNELLSSVGLGFQISQIDQNQNQENQMVDPQAITQTLEFRVCIQKQIMEYRDYPSYSKVVQLNNNNSIIVNGQYCFGFQFTHDYLGDRLQVFDYQELNEFPNY